MLRKNYYTLLLAVALFLTSGLAVSAQTAPVRGKVEMKKADGTTAPVADAVVDVYRTDIAGKPSPSKTNKKGEFSFAGLQLGGTFIISVSAPNIRPQAFPGVKAGNEAVNITVTPGDGKRFTEEEAKKAVAAALPATEPGGKPVELTAEQKKAQAEYDKQVAEITAKNNKVQQSDAVIKKVLEEGNKAFNDKNYDVAIAKYDEGITAEPDFAGSAPVLLNNKTAALLVRARSNYNQTVKGDAAVKAAGMTGVKKDLEDAVAASNRSLTILSSATSTDAAIQKGYDNNKLQALANRKEAYWLMAKTGTDRTKGKETLTAFEEYIALEPDAKKKSDTQLSLGDALRESGDSENAIAPYRKVLETSPDNPDALAGLGLSLFSAGAGSIPENTAQMQEGLNIMTRFAEIAPETHPLKASVKDAVDYLKTKKLEPQKTPKAGKKRT